MYLRYNICYIRNKCAILCCGVFLVEFGAIYRGETHVIVLAISQDYGSSHDLRGENGEIALKERDKRFIPVLMLWRDLFE